MFWLAKQQVSNEYARANAGKTLDHPILLDYVTRYAGASFERRLKSYCPNGVYVWGSKLKRESQTCKIGDLNTLFLFRRGTLIYKIGVAITKYESEDLAKYLWGYDADGKTWSTIYFFGRLDPKSVPYQRICRALKTSPADNWQGLTVVALDGTEKTREFFRKHLPEPSPHTDGVSNAPARAPGTCGGLSANPRPGRFASPHGPKRRVHHAKRRNTVERCGDGGAVNLFPVLKI